MKFKKMITLALGTCFTITMSMTAFAANWQQNASGWWYDNGDSTWPTSCWQWIDDNRDGSQECYYFNEGGYMLSDTTTPDGYAVNADGAWIIEGVVQKQTAAGENGTGYTQKINNTIWDLMDHTYAENEQKYGKLTYKWIRQTGDDYYGDLPYRMTYVTGFLPEEEFWNMKPFIIIVNSVDVPLNTVFEDAPDVNTSTSLESIGNHLEDLGYTVKWGKTSLGTADTCWITVDRFDIAFSEGVNESFDIKVRQEMDEKSSQAFKDAMNTPKTGY